MYLYRYIIRVILLYCAEQKLRTHRKIHTHTYLHIGPYGEMDRERKRERVREMEINVKRKRAKSVRVSFEYIISKTTRACTPIYT